MLQEVVIYSGCLQGLIVNQLLLYVLHPDSIPFLLLYPVHSFVEVGDHGLLTITGWLIPRPLVASMYEGSRYVINNS
jgi:hypothetical protein